jgi:hypothetical protein
MKKWMTLSHNSMTVLAILQRLKIVPGKSIARLTKEKADSLREYSVFEVLHPDSAMHSIGGRVGKLLNGQII